VPKPAQILSDLPQWVIWGGGFPLLCLNGWLALQILQYLQPFVSIFAVAALLAFILHYPVDLLQRWGMGRSLAVVLVFGMAIAALVSFAIIIFPVLVAEAGTIVQNAPGWMENLDQRLQAFQDGSIYGRIPVSISDAVNQITNAISVQLDGLGGRLVTLTLLTVDSLSKAALTLLLAFNFLMSAPQIVEWVFQRLPSDSGEYIRRSLQENFKRYFISRGVLAATETGLMTLAFLLLDLDFALLLGLVVGIASLISPLDTIAIFLVALIVAIQDPWLGVEVLAAELAIEQVIDRLISPRLVGQLIGLGSFQITLALLVGTKLGGTLGLIVAVPIAGFLQSIWDSIQSWKNQVVDAVKVESGEKNGDRTVSGSTASRKLGYPVQNESS